MESETLTVKHHTATAAFQVSGLPEITASPVQSPVSVVSLFSGCGGMDLGFMGGFSFMGRHYSENPFDIIWANDLNPHACATYKRNIGGHIHPGDVWQLLDTMPKRADVVIGGFPCQDISINGKLRGVSGPRSGLYRAMVEAIRRLKPSMFVAENVKGLLMKTHASSLRQVIDDFESLGYVVTYSLYRAVEFGIPQSRERVFIVGQRKGLRQFAPPVGTLAGKKWVTAAEAISDLMQTPENAAISHIWSKAQRSADQGSRRLSPGKPAATVRAECHGNNQFHFKLPRRISMREAARFQSFPDNFIFEAKLRETERQIGNAVPPVLAWHVARAVAKSLNGG